MSWNRLAVGWIVPVTLRCVPARTRMTPATLMCTSPARDPPESVGLKTMEEPRKLNRTRVSRRLPPPEVVYGVLRPVMVATSS